MVILTPIEKYKDILLKRDDKFTLEKVCGGKLRQAIWLIEKNLFAIKTKHNGVVVAYCNLKSPQSAIISVVARCYGLVCNIISPKTNKPNLNLDIAKEYGANIFYAPIGYPSVLKSMAKKLFPNAFFINMGFESTDIIDANMKQVKNLPDDLDYLIIPVGSAMNFISIIKGLEKYNIKPKKIVGVYVGREPYTTIVKYLGEDYYNYAGLKIEIVQSHYKYSDMVDVDNFYFDPIYEAKAYRFIEENYFITKKKCLLWVIGKRALKPQPSSFRLNNFCC